MDFDRYVTEVIRVTDKSCRHWYIYQKEQVN